MRELHSRISDGIHVRLLWHQHDDRVTVAVDDAKTGDAFTIDVREDSTYMTPAPTTPGRAEPSCDSRRDVSARRVSQ